MKSPKRTILFMFVLLQLLGAALLITSFSIEVWQLELLVSFTPQLTALLIFGIVISSVTMVAVKSLRPSLPLLIVAVMTWLATLAILFSVLSTQEPVKLTAPDDETVTFVAFNKLYSNYDIDRFTNYLAKQDIDILALQEVRPAEVPGIAERLGFDYTHTSRTFATSGGTSVALLSRFPFESAETIELDTEHPVVRAVVETPSNGNVVAYSVHIPVPSSPFLYEKRNIVLDSLARTIGEEKLPVIIGGDFNTTIFSPAMREFSDSVRSTVHPVSTKTIPPCSWYGYGSALCVRIDHVFVPTHAEVVDFTITPNLGADHRALITEIDF